MPIRAGGEPKWPRDVSELLARRARRLAAVAGRRARAERQLNECNRRTPLSELRHWSEYETVGEWYADFRGYVPAGPMAVGFERRMRERGRTFREAFAQLMVDGGRAVSVHPGEEPPCRLTVLLHTPPRGGVADPR